MGRETNAGAEMSQDLLAVVIAALVAQRKARVAREGSR
jgi:hypothetical protein